MRSISVVTQQEKDLGPLEISCCRGHTGQDALKSPGTLLINRKRLTTKQAHLNLTFWIYRRKKLTGYIAFFIKIISVLV